MAFTSDDLFHSFVHNSINAVKQATAQLGSNLCRATIGLDSRRQSIPTPGENWCSDPSPVRFSFLELGGIIDSVRWREDDASEFFGGSRLLVTGEKIEFEFAAELRRKSDAGKDFLRYPESREVQFIKHLECNEDVEVTIEDQKLRLSRGGNQSDAVSSIVNPSRANKDTKSVMKSALAGGLACAFSTAVMHPVDTLKTCVQASTVSLPELLSKLPQIGFRGLYKGSVPAIFGQFYSHGLRTGLYEASRLLLVFVAPTLPEIQVYSLASSCGTMMGTASRIPCEVLKQRLQAGIFDNVGEAFVHTLHQDSIKGFFRGTKATLIREVPFYVAGTRVYEEAKKVTQRLLRRELEPWEAMLVGAISGGLTAVATTPVDVVKTRMMTAPQGLSPSMSMMAVAIFRQEGPLGLFKGAVPRFFWVAPLGAINFAGYELIRKAMDKIEQTAGE